MKITLTTKVAVATGLTAVLFGGLVAPVAQADPIAASGKSSFGQLAGVGSDTIQDVDNGLQKAIGRVTTSGDWKLTSYDATGSERIQTKSDGNTSIFRPNGSGDGLKALLVSIGQTASATGTTFSGASAAWNNTTGDANNIVGDIQFSRSSSGPTISATGAVSYVPFAKDAVGYAVSANSVFPALSVGSDSDSADGDGVAPSTLWAIYNCEATRIITKTGQTTKLVNDSYTLGAGETSTTIRPYIPQSSSGTAKYWQGASGAKFGSSLASCVKRNIWGGSAYDGAAVQEHDGTAIENVAGAIMPFSIPKWIGMAKGLPGVTDVRHGAVLGTLNGVAPTSGSGSGLVINPDFLTDSNTSYLTRNVYHVVPYRLVTDPTTLEYRMFKGRTSLVCAASDTIANYGFGVLTATSGVNSCGDTSQRASALSTATVSSATGTNDAANLEVDFAVEGFTSNGTGGAKVYVLATSSVDSTNTFYANEANPAEIAAGSTDVDFSLPYSALPSGSWKLGLVIVPNLAGVANYETANDLYTKSGASTTLTATVTGKVKKFGKAVVTVSTGSGTPTGTVSIYKGTSASGTPIATGTLSSGTVTITTLPKQKKKGNVKLFVVYSGDESYASSTKAVTWKVK